MQTDGFATFLANGAITNKAHVKFMAGSVTDPPQVELAGVGEHGIGIAQNAVATGELVSVKLWNDSGTFEVMACKGIAEVAIVYAAAVGKVSDAAVGSALGYAKQAASGDGSIIEICRYPVVSTTAATVTLADAGNIYTAGNSEAAHAEIMVGMKTAQYCLTPQAITLETGAATVVFANAGADGFTQLTNKEVALRWNNTANPTKFAARFIIPPDLNPLADMVIHFLGAIIKAGGAEADSPTITVEAYFSAAGAAMLADTDCGGVSGEFLTAATNTWQEKTRTIALADIPAVASVLTLIFNPTDGELGTDDFALAGLWIEGTRACLTS